MESTMPLKHTVLIAEDDPSLRSAIRDTLDGVRAVDVLEAADGLETLRMLAEASPDILLLDLLMPEMTGFEVLRNLVDRDDAQRPTVLVMSALVEPALVEALSAMGVDGILPKPFRIEELVRAVREALAGRRRSLERRGERMTPSSEEASLVASPLGEVA